MAKRYNIPQYSKNLKKSAKNITGNIMMTKMPVLSNTASSASEVYNSLRRTVLENRSRLKQQTVLNKNTIFKPIKEIVSNAKDDLRTGKLYNEEREMQAMTGNSSGVGMSDLMSSMIDDDQEQSSVDMSAFDKVIRSSSASAMSSSNAIARNATNNAEYLGELSITQNTQNMIMATKNHMEVMKSFGNLEKIGMSIMEFNTKTLTDHILNTQKYQEESLNEFREIRKTLTDHINYIENIKGRNRGNHSVTSTLEGIFNYNGSLNLPAYAKVIKNNIKSMDPIGVGTLKDYTKMISASPISSLLEFLIPAILPKSTKNNMKNLDNAIGGLFSSFILNTDKWRNSKDSTTLQRFLGRIFGVDISKGVMPNLAAYKNQELDADLELKKSQAITEVIPSYLAELVKHFTGKDMIYNYGMGKFRDVSSIRKERASEIRNNITSNMYDTNDALRKKINAVGSSLASREEKDMLSEDIDTFLSFYGSNKYFDPSKDSYKQALELGMPELHGSYKSYALIKKKFKGLSKSQKVKALNERRRSLSNLPQLSSYMSKDLVSTGESAAFNGLGDRSAYTRLINAPRRKEDVKKILKKSTSSINFNGIDFNIENDSDIFETDDAKNERTKKEKQNAAKNKLVSKVQKYIKKNPLESIIGENSVVDNILIKSIDRINDLSVNDNLTETVSVKGKELAGKAKSSISKSKAYKTASTKGKEFVNKAKKSINENNLPEIFNTDESSDSKKQILDDKTLDLLKKYLPKAALGGAVGGFIGKMFKNHPFIGAVTGGMLNILVHTDKIQSVLWGDPKNKDDKGFFGELKENIEKKIIAPFTEMLDPFRQMVKNKIIDPLSDWVSKKTDKIKAWMTDKFGFEFSEKKKSKDEEYKENILKTLNDIKDGIDGKNTKDKEETQSVSDVIDNALNPDSEKAKKTGKNKNFVDNALDSLKKGMGKGISAGKGALISNLLGMGPIPGAIVGLLFGGKKKKKVKKQDEDDAKTIDTEEKELQKSNTKYKKMSVIKSSMISSLLGMGPIPGALLSMIVNNRRKKKFIKKEEEKEASDLQEESNKQDKNIKKAKKVKGRLKWELLGSAASSILGLGPIPGFIVGRMIGNRKAKNKEIENTTDTKNNSNNGQTDRKSIQRAKNEQALTKKFVTNAINNETDKNQELVKNYMNSADTEEELASAERMTTIAANINNASGMGVRGNTGNEKDGGLFSLLGRLFKYILPFIPAIAASVLTYIGYKKDPETYVDSEGNVRVDNIAGSAGTIAGSTMAGFGAVKAIRAGKPILGSMGRAAGIGSAFGYGSRSIANFATGDTSEGVHDALYTGGNIIKTAAGIPRMVKATKNIGKWIANTKMGITIGEKVGNVILKISKSSVIQTLIGPKFVTLLKKAVNPIKNLINKIVTKKAATTVTTVAKGSARVGAKAGVKSASGLAKAIPYVGAAITVGQAIWGFIWGWRNVRQIMGLPQNYEVPGKLKIISALVTCIDDATLGLLDLTNTRDDVIEFLYNLFSDDIDKQELQDAQALHKENYSAYAQTEEGQGITYEEYTKQVNKQAKKGTDASNIRANLNINPGIANPVSGYSSGITNYDNSTQTNIIINSGGGSGGRGFTEGFSASKTLADVSSMLRHSKNTKIYDIKGDTNKLYSIINSASGGRGYNDIQRNVAKRIQKASLVGGFKGVSYQNNELQYYKDEKELGAKNPSLFGKIANTTKNLADKAKEGLKNAAKWIGDKAVTIGGKISNIASKAWNGFKNAGKWVWNKAKGVWNWVTSLGGSGGRGYDPDYYSQYDPRWGNMSYGNYNGHRDTVAAGGCGPTVAAMALQKITGHKITPDQMAQLALSTGQKYDNGGTDPQFFNIAGKKYGVNFNTSNGLTKDTLNALSSGTPVVFMGKDNTGTSPFGSGSHYVLANGMDRNGNVNILDPQNPYNNRKYNLNDLLYNTTAISTPRGRSKFGRGDTIPAGATVYMDLPGSSLAEYGHVGIYDGNGNVLSNVNGKLNTMSLSELQAGNISGYKYKGWGYNTIGGAPITAEQGQNIVNVAKSGTVPMTKNMCQAWVADVYQKAIPGSSRVSSSSANTAAEAMMVSTSASPGSMSNGSSTATTYSSASSSSGSNGNKASKAIDAISNLFTSSKYSGVFDAINSWYGNNGSSSTSSTTSGTIEGNYVAQDTSSSASSRNIEDFTSSNITADVLNDYIASKCTSAEKKTGYTSILRGTGQYFINAGNLYGIDPRLLLSIAAYETGWGTSELCRTKFNIGGIGHYNSNGKSRYENSKTYSSISDGIYGLAELLDGNTYIGSGLNTLEKIQPVYCPNGSEGGERWLSNTTSIYNDLLTKTGGAGARGVSLRPIMPKKMFKSQLGRGGGPQITPSVPERLKSTNTASSTTNMIETSLKNKPAVSNTNSTTGNTKIDTTEIISALNNIIELLINIDKSNSDIANKNSDGSTTIVPIKGGSSGNFQGAYTNSKQDILNAIISGI